MTILGHQHSLSTQVLFGKNPSSTNWGFEDNKLWVDKGFGAKFQVFLRPTSKSSNEMKKSNIQLTGQKRMQILLNNISKSGFVTRSSLDHMLRKVLGILQDQNSAEDQKAHNEEEAARRARIRNERFAKPPSRKQVKALKAIFESIGSGDDEKNIPELLSKCSEDHAVASAFQFHKHTYVTVNHVDLKRLGTAARMIEEQPVRSSVQNITSFYYVTQIHKNITLKIDARMIVTNARTQVHALSWNEFTSHFMQKRSDIEYLLRLYALSRPTQRKVLEEIASRAHDKEAMILYPGGLMEVKSNEDGESSASQKLSVEKMNSVQKKALKNIFEEYKRNNDDMMNILELLMTFRDDPVVKSIFLLDEVRGVFSNVGVPS